MLGLTYIQHLALRALALFLPQADSQSPLIGQGQHEEFLLSVGSYAGDIAILKYRPHENSLVRASTYHEAHFQPSWQAIHPRNPDIIYSVDEDSPGGLVSFHLDRKALNLTKLARSDGIRGTVSIAIQDELVAVAAYMGNSVQSFQTSEYGEVSSVQDSFTYSLTEPGPNKDRQEAPHPHQVVIDPSGQFVVAADLGADLLRLYAINDSSIVELPPFPVAPGSGPRHGQFMQIKSAVAVETLFYLANELRNTVSVYTANYTNGTIEFSKLQELDTLPTTASPAATSTPTAGEIAISNDNRFLYVSNRNDYSFKNSKMGASDSIALYEIDPDTGLLRYIQLLEAGGITPRHFSFDKSGRFVAIAFQESNSVVIYRRDGETGLFDTVAKHEARIAIPGAPVCVQWL